MERQAAAQEPRWALRYGGRGVQLLPGTALPNRIVSAVAIRVC